MSPSKTVILARKYGLVETIYTKTRSNVRGSTTFTHIIVVDFESTCWKDRRGNPEIIEFPAVLLDLKSGDILEEFHEYIIPTENPILSDFCKNFTGITQDQVGAAMPLKACLPRFVTWYNTVNERYKIKQCAFVTWSDWDFAVCLHKECHRKNIPKPSIFCQWIDLRKLYKEHHQRPLRGLKSAVNDMGLEFQGREHSGIWDARNTAHLAYRLLCHGMDLKITKG